MLNDSTDAVMRHALEAVGFDVTSPEPRAAWHAFKAFAATPISGVRTSTLGYSAYQAADRDRILWLFFGRRFENESGLGWSSGCLLSCPVPRALVGVNDENWWWEEHLSLEEWFIEVETNPIFLQCLAIPGWQWEGFSE